MLRIHEMARKCGQVAYRATWVLDRLVADFLAPLPEKTAPAYR